MPNSHTEIYVHFVWATWDRAPMISTDMEERLYGCIRGRCREMHMNVFAIGGVADHVHLLARLPATVCVADAMSDLKGASSHFVTHLLGCPSFRWQGSYSAHSVGRDGIEAVRAYIERQKQHHANSTVRDEWELQVDPDGGN